MPITSIYASLLAVLIFGLLLRVILLRRSLKIGLGAAGDKRLMQTIRVHANAVESIPLALILLMTLEWNTHNGVLLHLLGSLLILSRVAHAWGLSRHKGYSFGRFWGTLGTWAVILVAAGINLFVVLGL